ncbi:MAG: hypothetical protein AB8B55_00920 [Mariniblastus sp.]
MGIKEITTGQDSFLDIVANLVGILIILVVVVGAQASSSWVKTKPNEELLAKIELAESELAKSVDAVAKLRIDNEQQEQLIEKQNQTAANLTDQRHAMLVQLEIVERQMEKRRNARAEKLEQIDAAKRDAINKQSDFIAKKKALESTLAATLREANAITASSPKTEVIEHFPNPIAKTVFTEEIHFRLSDGKIAYVPMDELLGRMKSEWKLKAEKLKQANSIIETVGPIGNFRMQYELAAESTVDRARGGNVQRRTVKFQQFNIQPSIRSFGEPADTAISEGSEFRKILSHREPRKTTVSVWVYPGSFPEHNQIKSWLHENGYQMASWPLDYGRRIAGGPKGFKTSAQ